MPNSMRTHVHAEIARLLDNNTKSITPALLRDVLMQVMEPVLLRAENRASIINAAKLDGTIPVSVSGATLDTLPPPDTPQPETGGNYNGYTHSATQGRGAVSSSYL